MGTIHRQRAEGWATSEDEVGELLRVAARDLQLCSLGLQ